MFTMFMIWNCFAKISIAAFKIESRLPQDRNVWNRPYFWNIFELQNLIDFSSMSADIGIFGLSTQAINLALNLAMKQQKVTVGHRSSDLVCSFY